ncbi:hypothetical protein BDZ89DRAFT_1128517 [Hymenopellis radicata]|nr:hypothetical protein BDZ89DRAFT_1128517 [Hymenopellis radicata]
MDRHGHDFVFANKEHYNKEAGEYENIPMIVDLTEKKVHRQRRLPDSTTLLNFACDTGLIEKELLPHIRGISISQGIMKDPVMQQILQQAQTNPKALQDHMKNPIVKGVTVEECLWNLKLNFVWFSLLLVRFYLELENRQTRQM